jgi:hypothetical protein
MPRYSIDVVLAAYIFGFVTATAIGLLMERGQRGKDPDGRNQRRKTG